MATQPDNSTLPGSRPPQFEPPRIRWPKGEGPSEDDLIARLREARKTLDSKLSDLQRKYPGYAASMSYLTATTSTITVKLCVDAPGIWDRVGESRALLVERIRDTFSQKYGVPVTVEVLPGSIIITIILQSIDAFRQIYEVVSSAYTTVEYIIRCIEQGRLEWPPMTVVFTVIDVIKRFFLGI